MLRRFLDPSNAIRLLVGATAFMYIIVPLYAYYFDNFDAYNLNLAGMAFVSCVMLMIGFAVPLLDDFIQDRKSKIRFNGQTFSYGIIIGFSVFLFITFVTAKDIPLVSYFNGASANDLSEQRGALFKGRNGWQSVLLYLFTFFSQAFVPYAIAYLFICRDRLRYIALVIFFLFTVSFLQKFLFTNAIVPLLYAYSVTQHKNRRAFFIGLFAVPAILYALTNLSMGSGGDLGAFTDFGAKFSADYVPSSTVDALWWRSFSVPVFTATDTLHVFYERFGGGYLNGSTSSFIAFLTGQERINIERYVFEFQWGWNDTANANSVFIVDAFINFGWVGVCVFSLLVGQSLRWFSKSQDLAMRSLWPIYCLALFNATFIGVLLSNGFLLVFAILLFSIPKSIVDGAASQVRPTRLPPHLSRLSAISDR
jgi:hypothetical protein